MGLSMGTIAPPSARDTARPRWPGPLQNAPLPLLCAYHSAFLELPGPLCPVRLLGGSVGLAAGDQKAVADLWGVGPGGSINLWELLVALVLTSGALSVRTKLAFVFRFWDEDGRRKLAPPELAEMLGTFLRALGTYCRWPKGGGPDSKAMRQYVRATFSAEITEPDFVGWASRQPMLQATLRAFEQKGGVEDCLDFRLRRPPGAVPRGASGGDGSESPAPRPLALPALPPSTPLRRGQSPKSARGEAAKVALPALASPKPGRPSPLARRGVSVAKQVAKCPASCPVKRHGEAAAAAAGHRCPLHWSRPEECALLSRRDVWLAHFLWQLRPPPEPHRPLARLIRKLEARLRGGSEAPPAPPGEEAAPASVLFRLTDARCNPLFAVCLGRMRAGAEVQLREFLQALCPCAGKDDLDLYEKWDLDDWRQQKDFVQTVDRWRCSCAEHWAKPTLGHQAQRKIEEQLRAMDEDGDRRLSPEEISGFALLAQEDAEALVARHDLRGDGYLNAREFVQMHCPDDRRAQADVGLEEALGRHFDNIVNSWSKGLKPEPVISPREAQLLFRAADYDGSGSVTLDELVGPVDPETARGLLEAYDKNGDGHLSPKEFQVMVGCES